MLIGAWYFLVIFVRVKSYPKKKFKIGLIYITTVVLLTSLLYQDDVSYFIKDVSLFVWCFWAICLCFLLLKTTYCCSNSLSSFFAQKWMHLSFVFQVDFMNIFYTLCCFYDVFKLSTSVFLYWRHRIVAQTVYVVNSLKSRHIINIIISFFLVDLIHILWELND